MITVAHQGASREDVEEDSRLVEEEEVDSGEDADAAHKRRWFGREARDHRSRRSRCVCVSVGRSAMYHSILVSRHVKSLV